MAKILSLHGINLNLSGGLKNWTKEKFYATYPMMEADAWDKVQKELNTIADEPEAKRTPKKTGKVNAGVSNDGTKEGSGV